MSNMRRIKKPLIKLGNIRKANTKTFRVITDTRQVFDQYTYRAQRVVVKVKQSYNKGVGLWKAHGKYLERDTARFGEGFSKDSDKVDIPTTLNAWQEAADEKLHKMILSPESPETLDLQRYTREVMSKVEADLGRELDWVAITHTNTDNPHVHVALRGVDANGIALDIESYLGVNLRVRCQELATNQIGPRLYPEILEKRQQELYVNRLTDVDRILLLKAKEWVVELDFANSFDWRKEQNRTLEHSRLIFLTEIGLAEKLSENRWRLSSDIRESLKRLSLCEQLVKEQVPGWQFLKTLGKIGVERKTLEVGERLIGRVIASNVRDPFGDQEYLLVDASDGKTYQLNQPKAAKEGRVKEGSVVLLERRVFKQRDGKLGELTLREFTSVRVLKNWDKSFEINIEAAEILINRASRSENATTDSSFAKAWREERRKRLSELKAHQEEFDKEDWREALGKLHFNGITSDQKEWNPRQLSESDQRVLVGEITAADDSRFLIKDIKTGLSRIVNQKDVGLSWPPSLGEIVTVSAKTIPQLRVVRTDQRIAELVEHKRSFEPHELQDQERKFVTARANSWVKWGLLEHDPEGAYRISGDSQSLSSESILKKMEQTLTTVRLSLRAQARRQPAWIKRLDQESISADPNRFTTLDKLLIEVGESIATTDNWLAKALIWRKQLWKERGVELDQHFEKRAREWFVEKISPTQLRSAESVAGRITNLSVNDERFFALDCSDGRLRYFRITDRIREQIESGMLEVGDVVTVTGRSFVKTAGAKFQQTISYLETTRLFDWQSSEHLLRAVIGGDQKLDTAVESDSFAVVWREAISKRKEALQTLIGLEVQSTKLRSGEVLIGKVVDLTVNDGTKILIEGSDGRLHLIAQGRSIRKSIKEAGISKGDVVTFAASDFAVDSKQVSYTKLRKLESWSTSIELDRFALGEALEKVGNDKQLFRSSFARQWVAEAQKRKRYFAARGVTIDDLAKSAAEKGLSNESYHEFSEVKPGQPVSGIVTEISFSENGSKPRYLILSDSNNDILYIKAHQGLARAIVDGRIQEGDQVTLSTKEFTKNGQTLHYTEIEQPELRKRELRNGEVLLCKLLDRKVHQSSFIAVDSPEGKTLLRVSRAIKNQIKSGRIRVGDVMLFSARESARLDLGEQTVTELRVTPLCNWTRSEYLDNAAVKAIRSETINDEASLPRNSFSSKWQEAVLKRAQQLKQKGVGLAVDWEIQLRRLREEERRERLERAPKLNDLQSHDLKELPRLEVLFNEAANKGVLVRSEANVLNFIAAAVKAQNARGNDTRVFEEIIKKNDWKKIGQLEEERARNLLINYRAKFDNAFATTSAGESSKQLEKEKLFERDDSARSL